MIIIKLLILVDIYIDEFFIGRPTMIQWIKDTIGFCVSASGLEEQDIRFGFNELEKRYNCFSNNEKQIISNTLRSQFISRDLVYICSWLCTNIESEYFESDLIYGILTGEFDTDELISLIVQTRVYTKDLWPEKYVIQKKAIEKLLDELKIELPYIEKCNRNEKDIVIITEQLMDIRHAPTRIVLETIRVLIKFLGYNVTLMLCPSNKPVPLDLWHNCGCIMNALQDVEDEEWIMLKYKDVRVKVCQFQLQEDYITKYKRMLHLIYDINPIFVYNLGTVNPMADLAGFFTSVVAEGMTKNYPFSVSEIIIKSEKEDEDTEMMYEKYLCDNQKKICMNKPFPVMYDESKEKHTRNMYGMNENEFIIAIVGNRLDTEVDEEFISMMKEVVAKCDNLSFAIIGEAEELKTRMDGILKDRVYWLGYCDKLINTYEVVDLYLNPKRIGGGWSSAIAMRAGVPVVTLPDCDVALWTGEDFVVNNYDEMVKMIIRYVSDRAFYEQQKILAKDKNAESSEQEIIDYVQLKLNKIFEMMEVEVNDTI